MKRLVLGAAAAVAVTIAAPAVMLLALLGGGTAVACQQTSSAGTEEVSSGLAPAPAVASATAFDAGCPAGLAGVGTVVVPPGTSADVATAILTSLSYVGQRSGWWRLCDRLVCRAYGYANSGYQSAMAHWDTMLAIKYAHPADRCPPMGSFVFWATGTPFGHVALVVENNGSCDPDGIKVVSNDVLDAATGNNGGVYLVTLRQIESGFVRTRSYLGWSEPLCLGALLPPATGRSPP